MAKLMKHGCSPSKICIIRTLIFLTDTLPQSLLEEDDKSFALTLLLDKTVTC